jgi:hypothetical protein
MRSNQAAYNSAEEETADGLGRMVNLDFSDN